MLSVHHVLKTVIGSVFIKDNVISFAVPLATDFLVIFAAINCYPVVIAVLVFVARIALVSRFASNAALLGLKGTSLICLNLIPMKTKIWTLTRSSSCNVGTFIQCQHLMG